jgi:hypothetical protein
MYDRRCQTGSSSMGPRVILDFNNVYRHRFSVAILVKAA